MYKRKRISEVLRFLPRGDLDQNIYRAAANMTLTSAFAKKRPDAPRDLEEALNMGYRAVANGSPDFIPHYHPPEGRVWVSKISKGLLLAGLEEQERALQAAKFLLEKELKDFLHEVERPDVEIRDREAVDLVLAGKVGRVAVEHTRLESRTRLIGDQAELSKFFTPIIKSLQAHLPSGCFHLHVPPAAVSGLTGSKATEAQQRVARWILGEAARLEVGSSSRAPRHRVAAGPPDLPFPAALFRWPASDSCPDGSLQLMWSPEPEVADALKRAILSNAGKLANTTADVRALVLQEVDVQLSNAAVTSQTLWEVWDDLARTYPSIRAIDWIILVSLFEQPIVYLIKEPGGPLGAGMRWVAVQVGS